MEHSWLGQDHGECIRTMVFKFATITETTHLGALYLDEIQGLENASLVSFEIWKVGLHMGTTNPWFPQNVLFFKRGRMLACHFFLNHKVYL